MKNQLRQEGNSYYITTKNEFIPVKLIFENIKLAFDFAYDMTFGNKGEHRGYRSGGQYSRKNGELFANTFQGKLAEFSFYNILKTNGLESNKPDMEKWKLGKWDETDFCIKNKKISVKSSAFFSNLLLLETKDWKTDGTYIPNKTIYDYHVFVRISPDIKSILREKRLFFSNQVDKNELNLIINENNFCFDIPGFISNEELKSIINNKQILPQNALLNGKVRMDAENYYCQSGDLQNIKQLIEIFK
jgi:hypothetical protein